MEMFEIPFSLLAFFITLWITSFFALLMGAKRGDMPWIAFGWIIASVFSAVILVGLHFIALGDTITMALSYFMPLVIFSFVYRSVNKMDWAAAITTNIMVIAIGVIATVIVIISLGKPLDVTIISLASEIGLVAENKNTEQVNDEEYEEVKSFTEQDLLAEKVIIALEKEQKRLKKSYIEPKFQLMNLQKANTVIGYRIRLLKHNGNMLEGLLSNIDGEQFFVKQILKGGVATLPISISSVKKLEVFR